VGIDGRQTGVIDDSDWIYGAIELQSTNSRSRFNQNEPSEATTGTSRGHRRLFQRDLRKRPATGLEWVLRLERHHRRHRRDLDGAVRGARAAPRVRSDSLRPGL